MTEIDAFIIAIMIGAIGGYLLRSYMIRKQRQKARQEIERLKRQTIEAVSDGDPIMRNELNELFGVQPVIKAVPDAEAERRKAQQKKHNQQMKRRRG